MNALNTAADRTLEYHACRYGSSKILFRGPARRLRGDYISIIGGTETFGKFIRTPYPDLIEAATGMTTVNLGCQRAGIDAFNNAPGLMDICATAQVTVVQIMGASSMSNRFFTVDPRQNDRFLRASRQFKDIYPEIDFSRFDMTSKMLGELVRVGPERLHLVRQELQSAWVARMRSMLGKIEGKKVLLWLADHAPFSKADGGTICRDPLFVDRAMLNAVREHADELVEIVASQSEVEAGRDQMVFCEMDQHAACDMLGPVVHDRVAQTLHPVLTRLIGRTGLPPAIHQRAEPERELVMAEPLLFV
ncbi:MAG: DUF6473 family protein [Rhodobacter sp.]|nr:DUF6473 family protein [Rhodobacter sp.]